MARHPGEPIGKYQERATCRDPVCRTKYRQHVMAAVVKSPEYAAGVAQHQEAPPALAPERFAGGFAAHNLNFKPVYGKINAPPSRTYGGVSSGWLVGGGN